jgi:predicted PurR-regulated permease PerM
LLQLLQPLWAPLGWAAIVTFLLYPLHQRLTARLNGRAGLSAGLLTALTPFLIIGPLVWVATVFANQVTTLVDYLSAQRLTSSPAILAELESYPVVGRILAWLRNEVLISTAQVEDWLTTGAQALLKSSAAMSGKLALGVVGTLVGFFLMLFLLFFLLRDGRMLLTHLLRLVPMAQTQRARLMTYLGDVMGAVIYGHALTALVQGTLVGIGFAIAGLPSPLVFGVFAVIAAFIPALGTALVLAPAVLYLVVAGRWGAALFLGLWSAGVGISDNFLRPYLTSSRAQVATLTVFVGVIGGVSAFGFIGTLIGPVLLALIVALLRFAEEDLVAAE